MSETNESWLQRLQATGVVQDTALQELREILIMRLRKTFRVRSGMDDSLLEDASQESLMKVLANLDQYQGRSRFTTWATTIAIRVALTELRRRHWKDVSLDEMVDAAKGGPAVATDGGPDPQEEVQSQSLVEGMYRIIEDELTEKQRTVLLAELKGMPQEEIGRRMGSNRNAVYKLTHDARKRLKKGLEDAGFTRADLHVTQG